jgi:outer membrane lipopolysaccharide assembly protein LptE/RlpB
MLKQLLVVSATVVLTACGTFGGSKPGEEKPITSEFLGGNIKVTYTMGGEFESISSTNTVKVTSSLPYATDEAFTVATLRARKQIVEFMKLDLESEKFTDTVYNSLQDATTEDRTETKTVNAKVASEVKEVIKQRSSAILQGTYVAEKNYDSGTKTVTVTVKSGTKDIATAKAVRKLMGN